MNELVEEDPNGPDVDGVVVRQVEDDFRGHVLVSATERFPGKLMSNAITSFDECFLHTSRNHRV
jgi:hypothetical protein